MLGRLKNLAADPKRVELKSIATTRLFCCNCGTLRTSLKCRNGCSQLLGKSLSNRRRYGIPTFIPNQGIKVLRGRTKKQRKQQAKVVAPFSHEIAAKVDREFRAHLANPGFMIEAVEANVAA